MKDKVGKLGNERIPLEMIKSELRFKMMSKIYRIYADFECEELVKKRNVRNEWGLQRLP